MDDQQSDQPVTPGQTYQPGQAIQPNAPEQAAPVAPQVQVPQPEQVPQPPVPPTPAPTQTPLNPIQQAPLPQQPYQQQQQPSAYPQPQPTQQPVQQFAQPKKGPSIKLIAIAAGAFIGLLLIVLLATTLLGGGGLSLTPFEKEGISFTANLPDEWQTTSADLTSLDQVIASPADISDNNNRTSATITRSVTKEYENPQAFVSEVEDRVNNLNDTEYQGLFNIEVNNLSNNSYGNDENPAFKISYDLKDTRTDLTYRSVNYYVYETQTSSVVFSFLYTDEYSGLGGSTDDIVNSYIPI